MSNEFVWTDDLVKKYVGTTLADTVQDMEYFKQSHPPKMETITDLPPGIFINKKEDNRASEILKAIRSGVQITTGGYGAIKRKIQCVFGAENSVIFEDGFSLSLSNLVEGIKDGAYKIVEEDNTKRDWEIVEFRTPFWGSNDVAFTRSRYGRYETGLNGETFSYEESYMLKQPTAKIVCVKRLSDNEVFSVGDEFESENLNKSKIIKSFSVSDNRIKLHWDNTGYYCDLIAVKKSKPKEQPPQRTETETYVVLAKYWEQEYKKLFQQVDELCEKAFYAAREYKNIPPISGCTYPTFQDYKNSKQLE